MFQTVGSERHIQFVEISSVEKHHIETVIIGAGALNDRTLVGGEGNYAGHAGELIFQKYMGGLVQHQGTVDYDFLAGSLKIDVKSKGNCKNRPSVSYDCTVPYYQLRNQDTNIYVFARISNTRAFGWICGWTTKKDFLSKCEIRSEGQPYNNDGRESVGGHGVVLVDQLYRIEDLKNYLRDGRNYEQTT